MTALSPELRRQLEKTVVEARGIAETGARAALQALAVHEPETYEHMDGDSRELRRRLRAHARQLGDRRDARSGEQAIEHLTHECAYEHWHGMLFARFLAENDLLLEPELKVPVTLDECEELAKAGSDKWQLAARFAHRMLPQVFRPDHPVFDVRLAPEHRQELERRVEDLPAAVFTATDALGWVYQFWQMRKKNDVNRAEVKVGAEELPAVTQIFTEPYMVRFLLDNSLGAWWAARRLSDADLRNARDEPELRGKAAIPGVHLDYLRFVRTDGSETPWRLAAGTFDGWPQHLGDLKVLDPCCGSGHFLVAAFTMLVPMRMEREGLTARDAVDAVLQDNLHGLELDARCVELAAFALALAAWKYPGAGGNRPLPNLHVACSGLAPNSTKEDWIAIAQRAATAGGMAPKSNLFGNEDTLLSGQLRRSLEALHEMFAEAPLLGSLIDPRALKAELFQNDYESVQTLLAAVLKREPGTDEQTERTVAAQGIAKAAELLAGRYHLVTTNVPYLARGKQETRLKQFCEKRYRVARNDLATVFLERCLESCAQDGVVSLVLPQNWLFLQSYCKLRENLLKSETWHLLARLGPGAFETISGEVVKAVLLSLSHRHLFPEPREFATGTATSGKMYCLDVSDSRSASDKAAELQDATAIGIHQTQQLKNPQQVISTATLAERRLLEQAADYGKGSTTGDGERFLLYFWEYPAIAPHHVKWLNSPDHAGWSGRTQVCKVPLSDPALTEQRGCWLRGQRVFGRRGAAVNKMRSLEPFFYAGEVFDDNVCPITPKETELEAAVWAYVESEEFPKNVRTVDQMLKVTAGTLTKVPFEQDRWGPDVDDGLRLNIRPFMTEDILGGGKGAGILRAKPKIHWRKDRGKEPESVRDPVRFPWFWRNGHFTGDRVNDEHYATSEKLAARASLEDGR